MATIEENRREMRRVARLQGGQVVPLVKELEKILDALEARIEALEGAANKPARAKKADKPETEE